MANHSLASLAHLSDADLTRDIAALVTRDRVGIALLLAHLAEFDERKLFRPAGYSSMFAYCIGELHFSEPEAARRIQAARLAREFPILFPAVAAGRLHLSGICMLAPHLTNQNAEQLIEEATHRSKREIELLLAERFPDALPEESGHALIRPVRMQAPQRESIHAPGKLFGSGDPLLEPPVSVLPGEPSPEVTLPCARSESTEGGTQPPLPVSKGHKEHLPGDVPIAQPPSPEYFLLRLTIRRSTHDKLRELQALLSHAVPAADVAEVLDRAFDLALADVKRRKFGIPSDEGRSKTGRLEPRSGGAASVRSEP